MEEKSRTQELSVREISLIRELAQIRKEHKRERDCQQKKVIDLKDGMMPRKSNMDKSMLKSLHLPA